MLAGARSLFRALQSGSVQRCFSSGAAPKKIGFIGLGNMGGPMAANLLAKGQKVVGFDVKAANVEKLVGSGGEAAKSVAEVAKAAETVITMLPNSSFVESVMSDMKPFIRPGMLFIDSSTIDPIVARKIASEITTTGATLIDAPVSGGVGGATAGTLTFMVGASAEAFERAKAVLTLMGKNIVHCGASGTGQSAKLANNLLLAISMIGTSEAMNLGIRLGVDPKVLANIVNSSSGRCWSSDVYNPVPGVLENVPSSRGYSGGFAVDLMKKDLALATQAAQAVGASVPLGQHSLDIYSALSGASQLGDRDFSIVYKTLADNKSKDWMDIYSKN
eukprot:gnl/Hemi2/2823_TR1004_c0_g1_i1.p1 gnl/Hemi2/2823_TR1004_c0_g1~~gnl/Hemi2/2823_TR1004_c0_g1_i1.p1  ORF type:complete len:332 (+),score=92.16 gnl/Hemi2/2823_TR1004_c0_g1_i1:49-1044(+)